MKKIIHITIAILIFISTNTAYAGNIFSDLSTSNENFDAIEFMKNNNIINGYKDGTFKQNNKITRAEFLKILMGTKFEELEIKNCTQSKNFKDIKKQNGFIHTYVWQVIKILFKDMMMIHSEKIIIFHSKKLQK